MTFFSICKFWRFWSLWSFWFFSILEILAIHCEVTVWKWFQIFSWSQTKPYGHRARLRGYYKKLFHFESYLTLTIIMARRAKMTIVWKISHFRQSSQYRNFHFCWMCSNGLVLWFFLFIHHKSVERQKASTSNIISSSFPK